MIYIIYKVFASLKNPLYYFKDNIFECFIKKYSKLFFFFFKKKTFSITCNDGKLKTYLD